MGEYFIHTVPSAWSFCVAHLRDNRSLVYLGARLHAPRTRTFSSFQTSCRQLGVKAEQHSMVFGREPWAGDKAFAAGVAEMDEGAIFPPCETDLRKKNQRDCCKQKCYED